MRSIALCLGLSAALASAQMNQNANPQNGDPRPEIHGVITEAGTHFGIAGLQVLLTKDGQPPTSASITVTDGQGAFRFQPDDFGHYKVEVKMDGYRIFTDLAHIDQNLNNPAVVVITRGNPSEEIRYTVARPGEMSGRVIDEETAQPLARFPVAIVAVTFSKGRRLGGLGGSRAVTDDDGRFVFPALMPGNYVVETLPGVQGGDRVMTEFSEADENAIDQDYETAFWPGGRDMDSAAPIQITSGQSMGVGTIKARKVPYYRIHGVFPANNCTAADRVAMQFRPASIGGGEAVNANVPCGTDFLIRGVQPGSYQLTLATQRTLETRTQATTPIEVTNKNVDVTLALAPGVDLDGRVFYPEGVPPAAFERLLVWVQPAASIFASGRPFTPDAVGAFHMTNAPWGRFNVSFVNLSSGFYVREIRYNGNSVADSSFTLTSDAASQKLEIVIDDKPAFVGGVVAKDDQPLRNPYVVLAKWPFTSDGMTQSLKETTGGDDGSFRFAGLAPGEYRLMAVPLETKGKLDEPGVLERLFSGAVKVTLDRGESQNVPLKPTDPLH